MTSAVHLSCKVLFVATLSWVSSAAAADFSVLSYNVYLRSPDWFFHDNHDWRAQHIAEYLKGYDAVVLQEAFSVQHRKIILTALASDYPYNTGILGEDGWLSFNGGVIILSRLPIKKQAQLVFEGCQGTDCIVQKGVLYTAIEKEGQTINLFGLHLQAHKDYRSARVAQFPQVQQFVAAQNIPSSELVLVAGDFNVDYFSDDIDGEFTLLTQSSRLAILDNSPAPSYDSKSNTLAEEDVTERLDYIFYSTRHLLPTKASNEVLHFRRDDQDLSDHHAVKGLFSTGEQN